MSAVLLPVFACATLGLAPYLPLPHLIEKLGWLAQGRPFRPIDVFDLVLHGAPWLWLGVALLRRYGLGRHRGMSDTR